jgi:hypothetical protein
MKLQELTNFLEELKASGYNEDAELHFIQDNHIYAITHVVPVFTSRAIDQGPDAIQFECKTSYRNREPGLNSKHNS